MDTKQKIEKTNEEAVRHLTLGEPVLTDIAPAGGDKAMAELLDQLL